MPLVRPLCAALLCLSTAALAAPRPALVPGGIAHVPIASATLPRPTVRLGEHPVLVRQEGKQWMAWVGLPLDLPPGPLALTVREGTHERSLSLTIKPKDYPVQRLTVKNRRMVNPDPADLARIEKEAATQAEVKTLFRDEDHPALDFIAPVEGRRSSAYGLRRFFNGEPRAPHRGLDIAAARGTSIRTPAAGIVTHVGDFFFNGKTVFVDHGQGLISMFCHMDRVAVAAGTRVDQGTVLGAVGSTGRATGPHLHWSVFLNGTPVDPALFIDTP